MNDPRELLVAGAGDLRPALETAPLHRILVVDDDEAIRELIARELAQSGYVVDSAEDGAAAWDSLQRSEYDLLVTDHNMPKVTGIELVRNLRSARMALPVILISGAMPLDELDRDPGLQFAAMLAKPFTGVELVATVGDALRGARNGSPGATA